MKHVTIDLNDDRYEQIFKFRLPDGPVLVVSFDEDCVPCIWGEAGFKVPYMDSLSDDDVTAYVVFPRDIQCHPKEGK